MALATMMANGNIIPQNLPQAKKIFIELANQNVPNAKESLASVDKIIAEKSKQAANAPAQPAPKIINDEPLMGLFFTTTEQ